MDRLQGLVFSFYREDLGITKALYPLLFCKMTRSMGDVDVECINSSHMTKVMTLVKYLKPPLALLNLGRNIVFHSSRAPELNYSIPIELDKNLYI
tara:strand:- start:100 stop:384 length:285 start_codon:yes stop_codon:yes gene_type:complete